MNRQALSSSILVVMVLIVGCAKKPATPVVAVPAPGGAVSSSGMTGTTAGQPSRGSVRANETGQPRTAATTAGRRAPSEFAAVSDLQDVHFDFDTYAIRPSDAPIRVARSAG